MSVPGYDLVALGRVSMDLFSLDLGAPFEHISAFDARTGGSPANVALGCARLGLRPALVTAVGDDKVGDYVLRYLAAEGVDMRFVPRKAGTRTGVAVLGIEPPDRFPLTFYRENPADIRLDLDDLKPVPLRNSRSLLLSGTALARGSVREVTLAAAELVGVGTTTFLDLDLRPDQWSHPRALGVAVRPLLSNIDVVIGTEEEFYAVLAPDPTPVMTGRPLPESMRGVLEGWVALQVAEPGRPTVAILKRGARGVALITESGTVYQPPFRVEVINTVGAGDAFAAGLIAGWLGHGDWSEAVRLANAAGAIMVTRPGCGDAMPTRTEVQDFLERAEASP